MRHSPHGYTLIDLTSSPELYFSKVPLSPVLSQTGQGGREEPSTFRLLGILDPSYRICYSKVGSMPAQGKWGLLELVEEAILRNGVLQQAFPNISIPEGPVIGLTPRS